MEVLARRFLGGTPPVCERVPLASPWIRFCSSDRLGPIRPRWVFIQLVQAKKGVRPALSSCAPSWSPYALIGVAGTGRNQSASWRSTQTYRH
jgi:hypothetical protein